MRYFISLCAVVLMMSVTSSVQAQGGGGQCGGMQSGRGMSQGSRGLQTSALGGGSINALLGPQQAYLQAAAAISAYQAQQREKRLCQHVSVYQKRRAEEVAARQAKSTPGRQSLVTQSFAP